MNKKESAGFPFFASGAVNPGDGKLPAGKLTRWNGSRFDDEKVVLFTRLLL